MATHNTLGNQGEQLAATFLEEKGYEILEKNYRHLKAEVDLIVKKENFIIAVEVKTRSTSEFGNPQDFLKPKQVKRLVQAMHAYMTLNHLDLEVRFDIIAIIKNKLGTGIEHLEDAFYHF